MASTYPELKNTVVVVGSSNIDLTAYMDRLPKLGETLHGKRSSMGCGGKGSNQAVMVARMGVPVTMVTSIGRDNFGDLFLEEYAKTGVDTRHVKRTAEAATGQAQIWVDDGGANSIVITSGANDRLRPEDIRAAEPSIASASVLLTQLEVPRETTLEALSIARAHGVTSIFNPAPALPDLHEDFFRLPSIICPNETELAILTEKPVDTLDQIRQAAHALLAKGRPEDSGGSRKATPDRSGSCVIVTLGERGALIVREGGHESMIPCPKVKAADTSGAGDCFLGSLAAYLVAEVPLDDAVARACSIAAISVQKHGTQASYPRVDDLPEELSMPKSAMWR